jgi:3-dehydroquinate synthase
MPSFRVSTPQGNYDAIVERGALASLASHIPKGSGKVFAVTTEDVWKLHGSQLASYVNEVLFFPGSESRKRLAEVETLADAMLQRGADRSSLVIAFGGGIVNDVGGFLAAIFMRGVPVIQIPTTLLAQVDAAVGGKTGVNLTGGKNLVGSFHQPLVVLIDPDLLSTLSDREYRAGLYEIIKCGIIRDPELFQLLDQRSAAVLAREPGTVDAMIAAAVRIKAEVVSHDEREGDLRRILNFGHTVGHALEAETHYERFLHGEAIAFGMRAATSLAERAAGLSASDGEAIDRVIEKYGPIPSLAGITAESLAARLTADKKTIQGKIHFVLPTRIGEVRILSGIDDQVVLESIKAALA